jgi:hypothetical protein
MNCSNDEDRQDGQTVQNRPGNRDGGEKTTMSAHMNESATCQAWESSVAFFAELPESGA